MLRRVAHVTRGRVARLARLEEARPMGAVRVVITRHIVEGGARGDGEGLTVARTVRRELLLYPDGLPRRARWTKRPQTFVGAK